jgi:prepilin-type N-terminal cleavage/methylation domain-containing protein
MRIADGGSRIAIRSPRGYTFVELLVVATIIIILASAIMPLARGSTASRPPTMPPAAS